MKIKPTEPSGLRVIHDEQGTPDAPQFCPVAFRIQTLAATFSTLQTISGIDPWDISLLREKCIGGVSTGTRQSLLFLLSVWCPETSVADHPFDLHDALKVWDTAHRNAFITWAENPWWP